MFNIVLVEPEIPQNTGNIVRTCSATGARLHLVKPLGFSVEDKYLKRAGLDYWSDVDIRYYENSDDFFSQHPDATSYFFSIKAPRSYTEVNYKLWDYFIFGKESCGLSEDILRPNYNRAVRVPMIGDTRSLNLSNTVAIAVYEAWRQNGFVGGRMEGELEVL